MPQLRKAVILFNLGGPDSLNAVKPFLFNLFNDKAILSIPQPFRTMLAWFISWRREQYAKKIYEQIGGRSPILDLTQAQAAALEELLNSEHSNNYKVFTAMRYWHPFAKDIISEVKNFAPDEVILLPLYPQFSTTTTASSLSEWHNLAKKVKLNIKSQTICCYPRNKGFIDAYIDLTKEKYNEALEIGKPIVLFSAHGIPLNRIQAGDPYEWQINETVKAIVEGLNIANLDYKVSYQSKVGPLEWLKPATEDEIIKASKERKPIVIVPVTFVSEHSETLVELDIMYKETADKNHCPGYFRVSAIGVHPKFIAGLKEMCLNANTYGAYGSQNNLCPWEFKQCACKKLIEIIKSGFNLELF